MKKYSIKETSVSADLKSPIWKNKYLTFEGKIKTLVRPVLTHGAEKRAVPRKTK